MTALVWRIAVEASGYAANDLSGAGATHSGGRWNSPGQPMVYASSSIALAVLETLSYIGKDTLPFDRFLVRIDIPDDIWKRRKAPKFFPAGWDAIPAGLQTVWKQMVQKRTVCIARCAFGDYPGRAKYSH